MLHSNYSLGFERNPKQIKRNNNNPATWSNPLQVELPNAPSMRIYCLYGHGKATERGYWYRENPLENGVCYENETNNPHKDHMSTRPAWIDNTVNREDIYPSVRSGVVNGEGDGTVSLLSLGAMCVEGWKRDIYNPAKIPIITHELHHQPAAFDPRGGPTTGDHVDILGSSRVNDIILSIVSGNQHEVKDHFVSKIREYAKKIRWDGKT